ncbi:hypothetical protein ACH5RR_024610 [Cinchona calisaya]|uniref:Phytocyanin domain-containing protein n=1 Tax=Cinchona calisaya TaxID=153742 RepID=A0ABD2Z290_9GENT
MAFLYRKNSVSDTTAIVFSAKVACNFEKLRLVIRLHFFELNDKAVAWVKENVQPFLPGTSIKGIAVGNEILGGTDIELYEVLVPALKNVYHALEQLQLYDKIEVPRPHSQAVFATTFRPRAGALKDSVLPYMRPLLQFFSQIGKIQVIVSETGCASRGDENVAGATLKNARTYNNNLRKRLARKKGTPYRPKMPVGAYIFALFNENLKPGPTSERNFGLLKPDGRISYDIGFEGLAPSAAPSLKCALAAEYVIGDGIGWNIPPNGAATYTNWASGKTFRVGDILVFNFGTNTHDVVQVPKASYDACNSNNAIGSVIKNGPANVTLDTAGDHYYICTFGGHCTAGQKVAISVSSSSGSPPGANPPTKSPVPTTTPPTTAPSTTAACAPTPSPAPEADGPASAKSPAATTLTPPPPSSSIAVFATSLSLAFASLLLGFFLQMYIRAKGLWSLVEIGFTEPIEGTMLTEAQQAQLDDARLKDHQVKHYLFQAIDRTVFEQILDRRTTKIVWDSMKQKFGGNLKVKKSLLNALRREFEVLEMKKDETITAYFARAMMVSNKMRSNGEDMPDRKIVEKILRTLTEKFTYIVVSIEESKDADNMSIDELHSETELDWGENIEINENTAEGGEIIEEPTEPVEPAAEVNCPTVAAPDLAIREGRNRHPPAWSADYVSVEYYSDSLSE